MSCCETNKVVQWYNCGKTVPILHKQAVSIFNRIGIIVKYQCRHTILCQYISSDCTNLRLFRFYHSWTLPVLHSSVLRPFRFYVSSASTTLPILRLLDCFAKAKTQHAVLRKLQLLLTVTLAFNLSSHRQFD